MGFVGDLAWFKGHVAGKLGRSHHQKSFLAVFPPILRDELWRVNVICAMVIRPRMIRLGIETYWVHRSVNKLINHPPIFMISMDLYGFIWIDLNELNHEHRAYPNRIFF